ncbi:F-box/FBD/LRR-repeat protein At5g56420-like [Vicia villosa]|uniref:F-box/FBD/LRR-repeat protein At5g56420-like n=1 Tax=Vicia villosa TaxID=3911 RepID=UPI00273C6D91|nr:F-box/FBD/LRR-repeat protein At5g56420-like [Vicia villosa]
MNNETLNPTIFTSRTLVVLKLEKVEVEAATLYVDLPSLKTLHLKFVRFENQNDIKRVLNACPNLQDLHTCYPSFIRREENNEDGEFKSLFLSKLVRAEVGSIDVPFNSICNVEYLRMIRAQEPSLEMNVEEIFKGIPVFRNLIHVELWFYGFFHGWDGVVELLRHCPKLQILFIRKWNTGLSKDWDCPILDLECVSSHLRSCTILNFDGSENDLRFSRYILQNARILQDMTINVTTSSSNGMQKHQVIEELSSCLRMSRGCELSFEFK